MSKWYWLLLIKNIFLFFKNFSIFSRSTTNIKPKFPFKNILFHSIHQVGTILITVAELILHVHPHDSITLICGRNPFYESIWKLLLERMNNIGKTKFYSSNLPRSKVKAMIKFLQQHILKNMSEIVMSIQQVQQFFLTNPDFEGTIPIIIQIEIFNVHDLILEEVFEIGRSFHPDG